MSALLPRLLVGVGEEPTHELGVHLELHGPLPELDQSSPQALIELVEAAGLRGRGGAAFPVARKLRAVAERRKPTIVVANGSEGEPASKKDRMLLRELPNLVLDGAAVAARAVGAGEAVVAAAETDERGLRSVSLALERRQAARLQGDPRFQLVAVPERFISGQESALVNGLSGAAYKPTFGRRPFERGVGGRPTLVQNVETLAHLGLIARHGAQWFRELGTERDPGSALLTLSGSVAAPGVYEIAHGMPLGELLEVAGLAEELTAVLLGGYFGSWVPATNIGGLRLDPTHLSAHGASLGAGVIYALGSSHCPVTETARIVDYLAGQSAGQCGPCVFGLGAIADAVHQLASATAAGGARGDLERWIGELPGRGACQFPDGAARFVASALDAFPDAFRDHAQRGRCRHCIAPRAGQGQRAA